MNKEIIKDEIQWLLEAINEQYEAICEHGERIPQIEFDILMENLRKFYENLHLLKRLDDPHFSYEKKMKPKEVSKAVSTESRELKMSKPSQAPVHTQVPQRQPKPAATPTVQHETPSFSKKHSTSAEIDLFAVEESPMNIKLKEARDRTFSPKIPSDRIENLKTAIIINDKFMFINELFDGNLREYNETIETLNGFKTLDQAADYLDLMRKKNFWNTGSVAFKKLKELVERRF